MPGRPKRLPHGGVDRVHITLTTAELDGDVQVSNRKPHALLYVRVHNARERRSVFLMLRHTGLTVAEEVAIGEHEGVPCKALRCVGTAEQLEAAVSHACVFRWEYVTNARVGFKAAGGGPEKVRAQPPKRKKCMLATERTVPEGETMPQTLYPTVRRVNPGETDSHTKAREDSQHTTTPKTRV